jgi:hypothetical protein
LKEDKKELAKIQDKKERDKKKKKLKKRETEIKENKKKIREVEQILIPVEYRELIHPNKT